LTQKEEIEMARRWNDLSSTQQRSVVALGAVQFALAAVAWLDLARRPTAQVNGRKGMWAAIIAINWVGPIAYFVKGRRG
jgi:hypothetical protein